MKPLSNIKCIINKQIKTQKTSGVKNVLLEYRSKSGFHTDLNMNFEGENNKAITVIDANGNISNNITNQLCKIEVSASPIFIDKKSEAVVVRKLKESTMKNNSWVPISFEK